MRGPRRRSCATASRRRRTTPPPDRSGRHVGVRRPRLMADELAALLERPGPGSHRTTIEIDGERFDTLEDLPPLRDRLLFVGLNPSPVSVSAGHYFQGRLGRAFWQRLKTAQILPADTDIDTADDALV